MKKVYVIEPMGVYIPGYGNRAYGEHFEMPDEQADEVVMTGFGLSLDPPKPPSKPNPKKESAASE